MDKCSKCIYRATKIDPWKCDYITFTGHSRGCSPGDKCVKYKKGERLKTSFFKLPELKNRGYML